ncbi:MAG: TonB-dependent receptor [Bacteroidetes bacterium]|nr:TonB-dependent receptor [Bacteroidota bacterium]MDA1119452.1 TonB-dependent receptor [Bacteroidota bacterium]
MKRIFLLLSFLSASSSNFAQVNGIIKDATNGEALAGATVQSDAGEVAISDNNGKFNLTQPAKSFVVSHVGYETVEKSISEGPAELPIALSAGTFNLNEVIVTAYHDNRMLIDVPGPISIISKKDLARDQDIIFTNALNRVPGVYMHSGALNTNRITIRGIGSRSPFSTNRVKGYLNEIPLTTGDGETTMEDIDLSIIDRVEIIKGPSSSEFGAALGGTINLKIQRSDFMQNRISSNTQVGSFGLIRNSTSFDLGVKKGSIKFLRSITKSDGYRENNEYDREYSSVSGQFDISEKTQLTFIFNFIDLKAFIPSSIDSATFAENPRAAAFIWQQAKGFEDNKKGLLGVSFEHQFSDRMNLVYSVFTNFRNSNEVAPFDILRENVNGYGLRFKYQYDLGSAKALPILTFGTEVFRDRLIATTHLNDSLPDLPGVIQSHHNVNREYQNYFIQGDWQFTEKFALIAGVNLNQTKYNFEDLFKQDGDQSGIIEFDVIASPRIGLNYKINPNVAIHGSVSHGFGTPTFEETRDSEGLINPAIEPETGFNYEIGSRGSLFSNKLIYDIGVYTLRVRDLLVSRRRMEGSNESIGVNAGKTTHNGFEMALGYQIYQNSSGFVSSINTHFNYSLSAYKFKTFVNNEDDFSGNRLTGVPRSTLNGIIDLNTSIGIYGNINYRFVDEIPILDDNSIFSEAYQVINMKLGFRHSFGDFSLDVYGGVNNLFDEKYASQILINPPFNKRYYYPGQEINWFSGIELSYIFD